MRPCENCGSTSHHTKQFWMERDRRCAACSDCVRIPLNPMYDDVFLEKGGGIKTNENICDPKTGREIPYITKQDKAVAMKLANVKQATSAERVHGYRNEEYLHRATHFEVR